MLSPLDHLMESQPVQSFQATLDRLQKKADDKYAKCKEAHIEAKAKIEELNADYIMADVLKRAGFDDEEVAIKMSAHLPPSERPVTSLTKRMEDVRTACGPAIADKYAEIDGPVTITAMSACNNFDITYGEKRIRIVTERGGLVTIMDGGNLWCVESYRGEVEPDVAAKRIVVFMIGGSEALDDEKWDYDAY
jgi:hypothetical protein